MKNLSIIVAISKDYAIGANNDLLWHIPSDLKRFKALTTGHTILMGRKTFESLPKGALPNRRNVVVSRSVDMIQGAEVFHSIEEALSQTKNEQEVFVIGGGEIYTKLLTQVNKMYLTVVEGEYPEATVFFPKFDWADWLVEKEEKVSADEIKNTPAYTYYILKRKEEI